MGIFNALKIYSYLNLIYLYFISRRGAFLDAGIDVSYFAIA
jgi:hypothetical protein